MNPIPPTEDDLADAFPSPDDYAELTRERDEWVRERNEEVASGNA